MNTNNNQPEFKNGIGFAQRCGVFALFLILILNCLACSASPAATDAAKANDSVVFAPSTRVVYFEPGSGRWILAESRQIPSDGEFCYQNQFYRAVGHDKALAVPNIRSNRLFEADRPVDNASRRPGKGDIVLILDRDMRPLKHAALNTVESGTTVRFQGKAYIVKVKNKLKDTGTVFNESDCALQHIRVTNGALRHIYDRHTVSGASNRGKSVFNADIDIRTLIKNAEILTPTGQSRGNFQRIFDAGRIIGVDRRTGRQTSVYTVITTISGILVTAYPGLP